MRASQFFKKGKYYKYLGKNNEYFTNGKIYKSFGYNHEGMGDYNVIQINKNSTHFSRTIDGIEVNGLGDGWWGKLNVSLLFREVKTKSHLPEWW